MSPAQHRPPVAWTIKLPYCSFSLLWLLFIILWYLFLYVLRFWYHILFLAVLLYSMLSKIQTKICTVVTCDGWKMVLLITHATEKYCIWHVVASVNRIANKSVLQLSNWYGSSTQISLIKNMCHREYKSARYQSLSLRCNHISFVLNDSMPSSSSSSSDNAITWIRTMFYINERSLIFPFLGGQTDRQTHRHADR